MQEDLKRLTNRYIAKTLTALSGIISEQSEKEIKHQFRYFENDVLLLLNVYTREHKNDNTTNQ